MKIIKTEDTKYREWKTNILNKIEKAGYILRYYEGGYIIKKEKGFFHSGLYISFEQGTVCVERFITGLRKGSINEKQFCDEFEYRTKIKLVKYI